MSINQDKMNYVLWHFGMDTDELIWNVIEDNFDDPHYSAVTATNRIKCYIELCREMSRELPYADVDGYLRVLGLSDEERCLFEKLRAKESVYYVGEQF